MMKSFFLSAIGITPTLICCLCLSTFSCTNTDTSQSSTEKTVSMKKKAYAYIGTYTRKEGHVDGKADGIYKVNVDLETGQMSNKKTVANLINPSFLVISPDQKYLYAVSELAGAEEKTGFIYAYKITADSLELLNRLPTGGQAPCHLAFDQTAQFLFVSNYVGGIAKMFRRNTDGSIKEVDTVDLSLPDHNNKASNLHSIKISPDNTLAILADKGKDKIWLFNVDTDAAKLVPHQQVAVDIQTGAGPRHSLWSKDGTFCYVINELDNTVSVIEYDKASDSFALIQSIAALPADYEEASYAADIHLHPNGKFLYSSNRGHNSIAIFKVDQKNGQLSSLGHQSTAGDFPRNFGIDSEGKFLYVANQNTSNISIHTIEAATGMLKNKNQNFEIETPVCIAFYYE